MKIKIIIVVMLVLLFVTSVSAEIVYSQEFYDNQNLSQSYMHVDKIQDQPFIWSEYSSVYEQRNTNILLMKQNELLQEQNNLTITQNEILRRIYDVAIHFTGGWGTSNPNYRYVNYPTLDV